MLQNYGDNATLHFCIIAKRVNLRRKVIAYYSGRPIGLLKSLSLCIVFALGS